MKKHEGTRRGFVQLSRAWYADSSLRRQEIIDEVMFGFYGENGGGGTTGEMSMTWTELGGKIVPQLGVFDDAWHALGEFKDLIVLMAGVDDKNISPEKFCEMLLACGFKDNTKETEPF